jgi:hypothetical protein
MVNETDTLWSEHLDGFHNKKHYSKVKIGIVRKMVEIPCLLIFVGSAAALLSAGSSTLVSKGSQFQDFLFSDKISSYGIFQNCIFVAFMAFLSNYFTQLICPQAVGGGIPEIKTILSGVIKPILLSKSLIVAKVSGLTFALLAGFSGIYTSVNIYIYVCIYIYIYIYTYSYMYISMYVYIYMCIFKYVY